MSAIAIREKLREKIGQTKVKRYWPGKAPEWAGVDNEENGDSNGFPSHESSDIIRKDDPRLRRLARMRIHNHDQARDDHRQIRQAETMSIEGKENMSMDDEDEDELVERRRRIGEKCLRRLQEETVILPEEVEEEVETDSEEETTPIVILKHVFVELDTMAMREQLQAEQRALKEEDSKRQLEERKKETKKILFDIIQNDHEIQNNNIASDANATDVHTDDYLNEASEYEAWKSREIARIKRDRGDKNAILEENEETEKVRKLKTKPKWRFMQKYHHKGAFFQSEDPSDICHRDVSAPTGEDKMDKTKLPKVMQVKQFGRSGRRKWTHLVNEDTTDWNSPWTYSDHPLRATSSCI